MTCRGKCADDGRRPRAARSPSARLRLSILRHVQLVVEDQEIRRHDLRLHLSQHGRELAAVVRRVIHDVDHLTPERVAPGVSLQVDVRDDFSESFSWQRVEERPLPTLDL